jgi:hypothetical protein
MKEYLLQNFYIADFFDKDKVKDLTRDDTPKADEANFVGGGVVYYSMNGVTESSSGTPYSKAVDAGYVNSDGTINANEVKAMLKSAAGLTRNWSVQSNYAGINREVETLDGIPVVPVPAVLMKSAYVFTEGWTPAVGASQINMFLVNPDAVITPVSYTFADLDEPTALSEGKYYYYEESFEDAFILNKKKDALQFNVTT